MHKTVTARDDALTMLRNWVSIQSGVAADQITDTSKLVGGDILDSFALISLTSLVEELVGHPLNDAQSDPSNFIDLKTILARFF